MNQRSRSSRPNLLRRTFKLAAVTAFYPLLVAPWAFADGPKVGTLFELSGPLAPNGENCRRGVELALSAARDAGQPVFQTVTGDYKGEAKTAVSEYQRITLDPSIIAMLSTRSVAAMAINPISQRQGMPFFAVSGHPQLLTGNEFACRIYPSVEIEGKVIADGLISDGRKALGVVTIEDDWTIALEKAISQSLTAAGRAAPLITEHVLPGETDFSAIVAKLKQSGVDSVMVNMGLAESGIFIRRVREVLPDVPLYSNFWGAHPQVISVAGASNMAGLKYSSVNLDKPEFRKQFAAKYQGEEPSAVAYSCFAGMNLILSGYAAAGADADKNALWSKIKQADSLKLPDETLAVKNREILFDVRLYQIGKPDGAASSQPAGATAANSPQKK